MKIVIKSDVFNISNRIKKLNKNYQIRYDTTRQTYELWDSKYELFLLTLPVKCLDIFTIEYIVSRITKSNDEILKEVEDYNLSRHRTIQNKIKENALKKAENILRRS